MAECKLAFMNREEARQWFIRQNPELLAGNDNRAKRQAWAQCIHQLIKEGGVDPAHGSRWMYPSDLDTYRPPVVPAAAPVIAQPLPVMQTNRDILAFLLQATENELSQPAIISVDIAGETHFRPVQALTVIAEPMFMTRDGLCPASGLSENDKTQHLEQIFNPGQILFTYSQINHADVSPNAPHADLPDRE